MLQRRNIEVQETEKTRLKNSVIPQHMAQKESYSMGTQPCMIRGYADHVYYLPFKISEKFPS
jgi:hypothetical protein